MFSFYLAHTARVRPTHTRPLVSFHSGQTNTPICTMIIIICRPNEYVLRIPTYTVYVTIKVKHRKIDSQKRERSARTLTAIWTLFCFYSLASVLPQKTKPEKKNTIFFFYFSVTQPLAVVVVVGIAAVVDTFIRFQWAQWAHNSFSFFFCFRLSSVFFCQSR